MASTLTDRAIQSMRHSSPDDDRLIVDPNQQAIQKLRAQVQDLFDTNDEKEIGTSNWVKFIPHTMVRMNTSNKTFRKSITGNNLSPVPKTKLLPEVNSLPKTQPEQPNQTEVIPLPDQTPGNISQQTCPIIDLPINTHIDQPSTNQVSQAILPPSQPVLPLPDPTPYCQEQISSQINAYENIKATSAPPSPVTNRVAKRLPSLRSARDYPFIEPKTVDDHDGKLTDMGWTVIEVPGDGNCGYFCFILGLESLNMKLYNPGYNGNGNRNDGVALQIFTKKKWDRQTIRLRKDLFDHARHLTTEVYKSGQEPEWWLYVAPTEEEEIEASFTSFYTEGATQKFYFKGKNGDLDKEHHMMADWGPFVFASLHNIRVIVVRRQKYKDKEGDVKDDWSTWIYSNGDNIPPTQQPGIYRMPDDEFTRVPSIEIFHTCGTGLDNHFQYLTRTSYDDETTPACPPTSQTSNLSLPSPNQCPVNSTTEQGATRNATSPSGLQTESNNTSIPVEEILLQPETVIPSQITESESPPPDSVPRTQSTLSQISTVMENKQLSAAVKKMYLAKNVDIRTLFAPVPPNRRKTKETNKAIDDDEIQSVTPPKKKNLPDRTDDAYREIFVDYSVKKAFELGFTTTIKVDNEEYQRCHPHLVCHLCDQYAPSRVVTIAEDRYYDLMANADRWYTVDMVTTFGVLCAHYAHRENIIYVDGTLPTVSKSRKKSAVEKLPQHIRTIVSVVYTNKHFAVMRLCLNEEKAYFYDGLFWQITHWDNHMKHVLNRYGIKGTWEKVAGNTEHGLNGIKVKQDDQSNCGPIACMVLWQLFHPETCYPFIDPSKYRKETLTELLRLISSHEEECILVRKRQRQRNIDQSDTAQKQEGTTLPATPNRKRKQTREHDSNDHMQPGDSKISDFFIKKKKIIESPSPERTLDADAANSCDSPKEFEFNIEPVRKHQRIPSGFSTSESEDNGTTENVAVDSPIGNPTDTAAVEKSTQSDDEDFMEKVTASRTNKRIDTSDKPRIKIPKKKMATSTKTSKKKTQKNCQCKGKCNKACGCRKQGRICTTKCACMAMCNNNTF